MMLKTEYLLQEISYFMLLHMESKWFFINYISGNTRAFLSLVIITGIHVHFFQIQYCQIHPWQILGMDMATYTQQNKMPVS